MNKPFEADAQARERVAAAEPVAPRDSGRFQRLPALEDPIMYPACTDRRAVHRMRCRARRPVR